MSKDLGDGDAMPEAVLNNIRFGDASSEEMNAQLTSWHAASRRGIDCIRAHYKALVERILGHDKVVFARTTSFFNKQVKHVICITGGSHGQLVARWNLTSVWA